MRLILFPLAHTSFKSMAKMKKLQPDMQRLKETYPDDRQKMQQELMALYKKEGCKPSCWMSANQSFKYQFSFLYIKFYL